MHLAAEEVARAHFLLFPPGPLHGEGSQEGGTDCVESPCLFNIDLDPNEHDDVAAKTPAVVQQLHARLLELAKSEVTVQAAGLCPTKYGSHNDPWCGAKAKETGFWEPWL